MTPTGAGRRVVSEGSIRSLHRLLTGPRVALQLDQLGLDIVQGDLEDLTPVMTRTGVSVLDDLKLSALDFLPMAIALTRRPTNEGSSLIKDTVSSLLNSSIVDDQTSSHLVGVTL
jgi:hypothetical protein